MAAGVAALALSSSTDDGLLLCPFRRCTGGYCPGCGGTRALGSLLRGDVAGSWRHHPIVLLITAQAAVVGLVWALAGPEARRAIRRRTDRLLVANAVVLVGIWILRLTLGLVPVPFAGWLT